LLLTGILGLVAAWRRDPGAPLSPFLLASFGWLLVLFLTTSDDVGGAERLLEFCVVIVALGAGLGVFYWASSRVVTTVASLTGCLLCVVVASAVLNLVTEHQYPNQPQEATVTMLQKLHLHKGYAEYWDAGIDRFLSRQTIDIINVECLGGTEPPSYYDGWSDKGLTEVPAKTTFYLLTQTDVSVCSLTTLDALLGRPYRVVSVPSVTDPTEILIYNYDIGPRLFGQD
jgi:hypothetical protein